MIITLSILLTLTIIVFAFLQQYKFGQLPKGERLEAIKQSPNYRNGQFQNIEHTPDLTEGYGFFSVLYEFLFVKVERTTPTDKIPSQKTIIADLDPEEDVLIWFGHSSYYIQLDGKKILVDPVFCGSSSPLPNNIMAFAGTDRYTPDDFGQIDYLFITHDHWDHIDNESLIQLKDKVGKIICGLGNGQHFEYWGFDMDKVIEKDWNEEFVLDDGFTVNTTTSRHFAGRGLSRNKALWMAYVLKTPTMQVYLGGDGGYGKHFAEIGKKFGAFDLVILENGQYDRKWKYIHMMPNEVLKAAKDLNSKRVFPVHSSKFKLANHAWDEPLKEITKLNEKANQNLLTPIIGEKVNLKDSTQVFSKWWVGIN